MKVYELMKALADCPAGAEVVFRRLAELKEMPIYDGQLRLAEFVITCQKSRFNYPLQRWVIVKTPINSPVTIAAQRFHCSKNGLQK